jgi:hypothetical protein
MKSFSFGANGSPSQLTILYFSAVKVFSIYVSGERLAHIPPSTERVQNTIVESCVNSTLST